MRKKNLMRGGEGAREEANIGLSWRAFASSGLALPARSYSP